MQWVSVISNMIILGVLFGFFYLLGWNRAWKKKKSYILIWDKDICKVYSVQPDMIEGIVAASKAEKERQKADSAE